MSRFGWAAGGPAPSLGAIADVISALYDDIQQGLREKDSLLVVSAAEDLNALRAELDAWAAKERRNAAA